MTISNEDRERILGLIEDRFGHLLYDLTDELGEELGVAEIFDGMSYAELVELLNSINMNAIAGRIK